MTSAAADRLLAAFTDPDHLFTRDQVAWIISMALESGDPDQAYRAGFDAGYQARVREENAAATAGRPPVFSFGRWYSGARRVDHRRTVDDEARRPRTTDYRGGPVEVW